MQNLGQSIRNGEMPQNRRLTNLGRSFHGVPQGDEPDDYVKPLPGSLNAAKLELYGLIKAHRDKQAAEDEFNEGQGAEDPDVKRTKVLMEEQIFQHLQCDYLVGQYALTMTDYKSVEDAVEFMFAIDENGKHAHPFIGYDPTNSGDNEVMQLVCLICQDCADSHEDANRSCDIEDAADDLIMKNLEMHLSVTDG